MDHPYNQKSFENSMGLNYKKPVECFVLCTSDKESFQRLLAMHLNDGTGWQLSGGVSITVQFTTIWYSQLLIRTKPK